MDVGSFGMFLYEIITWPSHLAGPRRWNRAVAMEKVAGSGTLGQRNIDPAIWVILTPPRRHWTCSEIMVHTDNDRRMVFISPRRRMELKTRVRAVAPDFSNFVCEKHDL
jgi:hypothetical protein